MKNDNENKNRFDKIWSYFYKSLVIIFEVIAAIVVIGYLIIREDNWLISSLIIGAITLLLGILTRITLFRKRKVQESNRV